MRHWQHVAIKELSRFSQTGWRGLDREGLRYGDWLRSPRVECPYWLDGRKCVLRNRHGLVHQLESREGAERDVVAAERIP